jgi:hypothetical protein
MQLKGFERITLKPGEKKTAEFAITPQMLSILDIDMHRVVEPGDFELMVGPSSDKTSMVVLTVAGAKGETGRPPLPPPPAGSESGLVSDFEDGKPSRQTSARGSPAGRLHEWRQVVFQKPALIVVQPGADGTKAAPCR